MFPWQVAERQNCSFIFTTVGQAKARIFFWELKITVLFICTGLQCTDAFTSSLLCWNKQEAKPVRAHLRAHMKQLQLFKIFSNTSPAWHHLIVSIQEKEKSQKAFIHWHWLKIVFFSACSYHTSLIVAFLCCEPVAGRHLLLLLGVGGEGVRGSLSDKCTEGPPGARFLLKKGRISSVEENKRDFSQLFVLDLHQYTFLSVSRSYFIDGQNESGCCA